MGIPEGDQVKRPAVNQYQAVAKKSFRNNVESFLREQIPSLGSLTCAVIVDQLETMIDKYYPPTERFRMGQVLWPAVDVKAKASYGKTMERTKLVPVTLDLIHRKDIEAVLQGKKAKEVRKQITARLFTQAFEQQGVLTNSDVAMLLRVTPTTVSRYVKEIEQETNRYLPRRGVVHDLGPCTTHKKQICYQVIVEGRSVEETARRTHHSPAAVTRYVRDYKRVYTCLKEGLTIDQTRYVVNISKKLVEEYVGLIEQQHHDLEALVDDDLPF